MSDFYLVQRLTRRDHDGAKGFDRLFGCQYMGSAEFEWGAIPESLKRIRASKVALHVGEVARKGAAVTVYVVGPRKVTPTIPDRLTAWLVDDYPRGKEMSYFPDYVEGMPREYATADAWWSLNEDVMWTLDAEVAQDLLRAVKS